MDNRPLSPVALMLQASRFGEEKPPVRPNVHSQHTLGNVCQPQTYTRV